MTAISLGSLALEVACICREIDQFPTMSRERLETLSDRACVLLDEIRLRAPHDGE